MNKLTILLISEDSAFIEPMGMIVRSIDGLRMVVVPDVAAAHAFNAWENVALVLIHQQRPEPVSGVSRLLQMIVAERRPIATLVIGNHYDSEQAHALLRLGVADFLTWPEETTRVAYLIEVLTIRVRELASQAGHHDLRMPASGVKSIGSGANFEEELPGADRLMNQVRRVASQDANILLSGETGTGKSRLAQIIHELSPRKYEPYLVINCGSISSGMIESEMFGHLAGSIPGAEFDQVGKFVEVGQGTMFLDEIESLPLPLQAKLLRVVEDRLIRPIGSSRDIPFRARLIAASNISLGEEVMAQRFRSDLYYRLNVIEFYLPPLRDRVGAIARLATEFLSDFAGRINPKITSIHNDVFRVLEDYNWPGNVRELRNVIERAVTFCQESEIQLSDLPESILKCGSQTLKIANPSTDDGQNIGISTIAQMKREVEILRITEALEKHSNNRLRAASELGISRMTLYKKLYKYGLMQPSRSLGPSLPLTSQMSEDDQT